MSSLTPNLSLILPIGQEYVSRAVFNGNMTLIDTAYGTLKNNIGKTTLVVNATSISAFETGINSILASMQDTEVRALRVTSSITNNGFKSGVTYSGYITRLSSGWGSISLVDHTGVDMIIGISGGAYFYNSLTDKITNNKWTLKWYSDSFNPTTGFTFERSQTDTKLVVFVFGYNGGFAVLGGDSTTTSILFKTSNVEFTINGMNITVKVSGTGSNCSCRVFRL